MIHQNWSTMHYTDVKMGAIASQITSLTIVYSTVYSGADQRKRQSSESLAFEWGIHSGQVNSPHKWPVTWKTFPFDDIIMETWDLFQNRDASQVTHFWDGGWGIQNIICFSLFNVRPMLTPSIMLWYTAHTHAWLVMSQHTDRKDETRKAIWRLDGCFTLYTWHYNLKVPVDSCWVAVCQTQILSHRDGCAAFCSCLEAITVKSLIKDTYSDVVGAAQMLLQLHLSRCLILDSSISSFLT